MRLRTLICIALLFAAAAAAAAKPTGRSSTAPVDLLPPDGDWVLAARAAGAAAAEAAAFGRRAGAGATMRALGAGFQAAVACDPFDPEALQAAGIDEAAPLALAGRKGVELAVFHLRQRAGDAHLDTWLGRLGAVEEAAASGGWRIRIVRRGDRPIVAVARKERAAIVARLSDPAGDLLDALNRTIALDPIGRSAAAAKGRTSMWSVALRLPRANIDADLHLRDAALAFDGIASIADMGAPLAEEGAAYPQVAPPGDLLVARLLVAPDRPEVRGAIGWLAGSACPRCEGRERMAAAIARQLRGPLLLGVAKVEPAKLLDPAFDPLSTPFAWIAEARDAAKAEQALVALAEMLGAERAGGAFRAGGLLFGRTGERIWVTTQVALRDRLLGALGGERAGAGAPVEVAIEPRVLGAALADLGLADALRDGRIAALVALRPQLLPLLQGNGPIAIRAAPRQDGTLRFEGAWTLDAAAR